MNKTIANSAPNLQKRIGIAFVVTQLGLFFGLVWKLGLITPEGLVWQKGFFLLADEAYHRMPLDDSFFPDWLRSAGTARWAYLTTVTAIIIGLIGRLRSIRLIATSVSLVALSVLCVHQASYNDATFVTCWWTTLWTLWFVSSMHDRDQTTTLQRGAFLSRLILSMILLGGAIGKWTPEYWSGDVFYDIYFRDREQWMS